MNIIKKFFVVALAFIMHVVGISILCVLSADFVANVSIFEALKVLYSGCGLSFFAIILISTIVSNKTAKRVIRAVACIPIIVSIGFTIVFMVS